MIPRLLLSPNVSANAELSQFTNPRMHLLHIPQCSIQNRNVHISVLNGALWDMEQVHSGICEIGLLPAGCWGCAGDCKRVYFIPKLSCEQTQAAQQCCSNEIYKKKTLIWCIWFLKSHQRAFAFYRKGDLACWVWKYGIPNTTIHTVDVSCIADKITTKGFSRWDLLQHSSSVLLYKSNASIRYSQYMLHSLSVRYGVSSVNYFKILYASSLSCYTGPCYETQLHIWGISSLLYDYGFLSIFPQCIAVHSTVNSITCKCF